jgi:hypothetical protein
MNLFSRDLSHPEHREVPAGLSQLPTDFMSAVSSGMIRSQKKIDFAT